MTADSDFLVPCGQVQAPTPEVMGRIERRWEGLRERVEAKLQTLKGVDRRQESRLLDQAAKAGTVAKRVTWLRKAADSVTGSAAPLAACRNLSRWSPVKGGLPQKKLNVTFLLAFRHRLQVGSPRKS